MHYIREQRPNLSILACIVVFIRLEHVCDLFHHLRRNLYISFLPHIFTRVLIYLVKTSNLLSCG
jgi:hypothetical protein